MFNKSFLTLFVFLKLRLPLRICCAMCAISRRKNTPVLVGSVAITWPRPCCCYSACKYVAQKPKLYWTYLIWGFIVGTCLVKSHFRIYHVSLVFNIYISRENYQFVLWWRVWGVSFPYTPDVTCRERAWIGVVICCYLLRLLAYPSRTVI